MAIANAPCSWGALEFAELEGDSVGYEQMLDELQAAGYVGTELGDWGFMPTDPAALRGELERRCLGLAGGFVPVALADANAHGPGEAHALRVARLLATVGGDASANRQPVLVLADANGTDPARTRNAGRIRPELGLSARRWQTFVRGAERIARAVRDVTGLQTAFHHHCAGYVETPDEIARFLELTDPSLIGLTFDTGHYAYGSGTTDPASVPTGLECFGDRVRHVHVKDCDPQVAARARAAGWDYFEAIRRGLFCELGRGSVDFPALAAWLRGHDYRGWMVVEQDILPGMGAPRQSAERNRAYLASIGL